MGASRRFLAQITRHQNEVKFISASLQYSNYAGQADFVVPYEILTASQWVHDFYLKKCRAAMEHYADIGACGISRDAAGYLAPQSLRNVLIISATPYQWKHMIGQLNIPPQTGQQNGGNRSRVTVEMSPGVRLQVQAVE